MSNEAALIDQLGYRAYPHKFDTTATVSALVETYGDRSAEQLEAERIETVTAGRIISIRSFGKASFLVLSDGRRRLQVYLRQDALSAQEFALSKLLDFGDQVGVAGHLFRT